MCWVVSCYSNIQPLQLYHPYNKDSIFYKKKFCTNNTLFIQLLLANSNKSWQAKSALNGLEYLLVKLMMFWGGITSHKPSDPKTRLLTCFLRSKNLTSGVEMHPQLWAILSPKLLDIISPGTCSYFFQILRGPMKFPLGHL